MQATLHNQHWKRDDGKPWTRAMFMPGYVQPEETYDWKAQQALLLAAKGKHRTKTPEQRRAHTQLVRDRAGRSKRAAAAKAAGATAEEIKRIMEG